MTDSEWSAMNEDTEESQMLLDNLKLIMTEPTPADAKEIRSTPSVHPVMTGGESAEPGTKVQSHPQSGTLRENTPIPAPSSTAPPSTPISARSSEAHPSSSRPQDRMVTMFREAMQAVNLKAIQGMLKAYLRMEDTGGQPELMDMLPAICTGPGLYLLFVDLRCDLQKTYKVSHCSQSGESTEAVPSTYTVEEMLLSTLSSICCSNTSTCTGLSTEAATDPVLKDILESSKSVAYIVGTYRDKVTEKQMEEFDKKIQKVIRTTDFFKKGIVQFYKPSSNKMVVPMDNMKGGKEEINKIRKLLEDAIGRHFKKLRVPLSWLAFSLCLRKYAGRTATLEFCLELSKELEMSEHETKVALWFLHHHAGVVMYFPDIPLLKDLVIVDPQVVYDSVTFLILRALRSDRVDLATSEKFRETGQFSKEDLVRLTVDIPDHIPVPQLLALLKFLHIVACIDSDGKETYIMPCVLNSASKEELVAYQKDEHYPNSPLPIMIRYKCGYVPIGIFPAIIASFIGGEKLSLIEEGIKKNYIQFHFGKDYDEVTFIAQPTYYEIRIARTSNTERETHEVCTELRREVESTFKIVSENIKYGSIMDYQFSFECPRHRGKKHLCIIKSGETSPKKMLCLENLKRPRPYDMEEEHLVWYGKVSQFLSVYHMFRSSCFCMHNMSCVYEHHMIAVHVSIT